MNIKILVVLAAIGIISVGGIAFAEVDSDEVDSDKDERKIPAWEKNMINHGNDPTTKTGYGCQHGKMMRTCPSPLV